MKGPRRNDPCPCGSGKKYKKCCLIQEREEAAARSRPSMAQEVIARCVGWLLERDEDEVAAELGFYLEMGGEEVLERLDELSEDDEAMVYLNSHDWLLADGSLPVDGDDILVRDILLGPEGPLLEAAEREWLVAFLGSPLGLYEVTESVPGEGIRLRDLIHPETPSVWVAREGLAEGAVRGDVIGVRLIPGDEAGDALWDIGQGLYPFERVAGHTEWVESIRDEVRREGEGDPDTERYVLSALIVADWLGELTEPPDELPTMVDAASGDPLLLVTDHYRVKDRTALAAALGAQPDVDSDGEGGWVRFQLLDENDEDGARRSLLSLDVKKGDRLEAFARTRRRADEGREWLERVAGRAVSFRTREITDPMGFLAAGGATGPPAGKTAGPVSLPTEAMQQILEQQYRGWAGEKIPALDGKTPRQALRSKKGRAAVIDLIELYENGEERAARDEGRRPASFQFLRDQLGIG